MSKYGVDVATIDRFAATLRASHDRSAIYLIDEIGKMECDAREGVAKAIIRPTTRTGPSRSWLSRWDALFLDDTSVRRYLTSMKTTVSSKGQIVLPAELRQQDRIEPGQEFQIERLDRGEYRLVRRPAHPNDGVVDWLLACPAKDFFIPIESPSTDTL